MSKKTGVGLKVVSLEYDVKRLKADYLELQTVFMGAVETQKKTNELIGQMVGSYKELNDSLRSLLEAIILQAVKRRTVKK